jgi:hypothetical protein
MRVELVLLQDRHKEEMCKMEKIKEEIIVRKEEKKVSNEGR